MPWTLHTLYWMIRLINILDYVIKAGCSKVTVKVTDIDLGQ